MLLIIDKLYLKNGVIMYDSDDAVIKSKYDFSKPTVVHISSKEMEMLHKDGRLETDGITIIYEK